MRDGFAFLDPETGTLDLVAPVEADKPGNRMNDGKCDPAGRFFAGTKAEDDTPGAGALYRLDADLTATRVVDDVTISNGLDWSPDGRLLYFVDSATGRIDLFDRDPRTGLVAGRRPFVELPADAGWPDGLTVDAEGCVWVALWGGAAVRRYRPDGRLDRVLRMPVSRVTSCAFGGSGPRRAVRDDSRGRSPVVRPSRAGRGRAVRLSRWRRRPAGSRIRWMMTDLTGRRGRSLSSLED